MGGGALPAAWATQHPVLRAAGRHAVMAHSLQITCSQICPLTKPQSILEGGGHFSVILRHVQSSETSVTDPRSRLRWDGELSSGCNRRAFSIPRAAAFALCAFGGRVSPSRCTAAVLAGAPGRDTPHGESTRVRQASFGSSCAVGRERDVNESAVYRSVFKRKPV